MNYLGLKRIFVLLALLVVLLLLAACAPAASNSPTQPQLAGTQWTLVSFGPKGAEAPVLPGAKLTLGFQEGNRLSGSGGCNSFSGGYTVDGGKMTVGPLASTRMACADMGLTNQETGYLAALQQADGYRVEQAGETLIISYDGGKGALRFVRG